MRTVIRFLIQQKQAKGEDRLEITKAIYHLSLILDEDIEWDDDAKSTVIWIIGEFTGATDNMIGPDVLRRLLKTYSSESAPVRYQILVLAAKVYSQNQDHQSSDEYANQVIFQMVQHVLPNTTTHTIPVTEHECLMCYYHQTIATKN